MISFLQTLIALGLIKYAHDVSVVEFDADEIADTKLPARKKR